MKARTHTNLLTTSKIPTVTARADIAAHDTLLEISETRESIPAIERMRREIINTLTEYFISGGRDYTGSLRKLKNLSSEASISGFYAGEILRFGFKGLKNCDAAEEKILAEIKYHRMPRSKT